MSAIDYGNSLTASIALLFLVDDAGVPTELVNNNVATVNGTPTVGSGTGYVGTADLMHLVAADSDYYSLPNDVGYQVTGAMTIAWLGTLSSGGDYRDFVNKINLATSIGEFSFRTSNANPPVVHFERFATTSTSNQTESTATLSIGSPHAVLATHDGDQAHNQRIWVDGTEGATQIRVEGGTLGDSGVGVRIGRRSDGVVQMDGYDEMVVVWARVLSDAEIASFFADPYQLITAGGAAPQLAYPIADVSNAGWRRKGPGTEAVRNLFTFPEAFDNAAWTKTGCTITANGATDPKGGSAADILVETGTGSHFLSRQTALTASADYVLSCKVHANARGWVFLQSGDKNGVNHFAYFNVSTGSIGTLSGCTPAIIADNNGFYRPSILFNAGTGIITPTQIIAAASADGVISYAGSSNALNLWGAQFELGSLTDYQDPANPALEDSDADLFTAVGETPRNDATFIYVTAPGIPCELELTALGDPTESGAYSYLIPAYSPQSRSLYAEFIFGGVTVRAETIALGTSIADNTVTLTTPEIALIPAGTYGGHVRLTGLA